MREEEERRTLWGREGRDGVGREGRGGGGEVLKGGGESKRRRREDEL